MLNSILHLKFGCDKACAYLKLCSSFWYNCSKDVGRQQKRLGKYKRCERRRRQEPSWRRGVVLHGDIRFRFNERQEGFRDCYRRDLQQCQQEGPELRYLQSWINRQSGNPFQKWNWWIKENPKFFMLFQLISFIQKRQKVYKLRPSHGSLIQFGWLICLPIFSTNASSRILLLLNTTSIILYS